jgi:hypothetical protein
MKFQNDFNMSNQNATKCHKMSNQNAKSKYQIKMPNQNVELSSQNVKST